MSEAEPTIGPVELRYAIAPITAVEVRDPSGNFDDTYTMSGYAAVYDTTTTLLDSRFVRLTESIDSRAFDAVLRDQGMDTAAGVVHFNFGHDMNRAVAATDVPAGEPGSLKLESHRSGLYFEAKVPRDDPDGQAMAVKMRSGVLRQASFAFTIADGGATYEEASQRDEDGELEPIEEHRTITEIGHLYDVCATPQGAYSSTEAGLRAYARGIGQPDSTNAGGQQRQPGSGGVSGVSPETGSIAVVHPVAWPDLSEALARHRPIAVDRTPKGANDARGERR